MDNLIIYVISDSVGETAQQVTKAALSQFNAENDCEIRRFPYVADEKFLMEVLESGKNEGAIIVYTLVSENLLNIAKNFCDKEELSHVDSSNIFVSTDVTLIFASVRRFSKSDLIVLESNDGSAYIVNLIKFG